MLRIVGSFIIFEGLTVADAAARESPGKHLLPSMTTMGLPFLSRLRKYGVGTSGVIHVGAHSGQEYPSYQRLGFERQLWIEPQPNLYARLVTNLPKSPMICTANVACGERAGEAVMNVLENNDGASNSLLKPKLHLEEYPKITPGGTFTVPVARLDDVIASAGFMPIDFSFLVVDVQGYELHVLRGAPETLKTIRAAMVEVYLHELYAGCALLPDVDAHMEAAGMIRIGRRIGEHHYGDALYVRREATSVFQRLRLRFVGPLHR